ncbi:MAG: fibro-slime domain-containing protein [Deltaproteobacteria bacterium]|nr:fibro-slime domain-containing protein [Deltaproteobacteria bacterium]
MGYLNIFFKTLFLSVFFISAACENEPSVPVYTASEGEIKTDDNASDDLNSQALFFNEFAESRAAGASVDECCESPGHIFECWEKDIELDAGRIGCDKNSDCADGQTCDATLDGGGFAGRCTCASDQDCRDDDGFGGGICYLKTGVCGPSFCNGYFVCNCWGGCSWWTSEQTGMTPKEMAEANELYCCEGSYPHDSNYGFFTKYACEGGSSTVNCTDDADCDDGNSCTKDECKGNVGSKLCYNTVTEGVECDIDGLSCTVDKCDSGGLCIPLGQRCQADSYIDKNGVSVPNTCTEDCREDPLDTDGDNKLYACNVPLEVPTDTDVKPSDSPCDYWTCTLSSPVIPIHKVTVCTMFDDECNIYECDEDGSKDNCESVSMGIGQYCSQSNTSDKCTAAECEDVDFNGIATCEDYNLSPPFADNDTCTSPECDSATGNWSVVADSLGDTCDDNLLCTENDICTATGSCEGTYKNCTVLNDDCNSYSCNGVTGSCEISTIFANSVCDDGDFDNCTLGKCDGSGTCNSISASCSGTASECNMMQCISDISGCANIAEPSLSGTSCVSASGAPNCLPACSSIPHSNTVLNSAGYDEGVCSVGNAVNDSCENALELAAFTEDNFGLFGVLGSTACAGNSYESSNLSCVINGKYMGRNGSDAVYKFTYEPSSDCSRNCSKNDDCNDGSTCTDDSCNTVSGECVYADNSTCSNIFIVPGRIQAQDFTNAYDKSSGNSGGKCTSSINSNVDMENTSDNGGTCNIGWVEKDEWVEYNILISEVAEYSVTLRVASASSNRKTHIEIDGVNVGQVVAPNNGWQAFEDRDVTLGTLNIGQHTVRVFFDTNNTNLNYIEINKTSTGGTTCSRQYVVKVESEFDSVVYTSKNPCPSGSIVNSAGCVENEDGTLRENNCDSPFDCSFNDTAYSQYLSSAIIREEPTDSAVQTVYLFVDSQSVISDGGFYISVEKLEQCPHPSTWYSGVIHNRINSAVNSSTNTSIQAVIRDFSKSHSDFESYSGSAETTGLVQATLGSDGKPVFASDGCSTTYGCQLTGESYFDEWYNTVEGTNYEKPIEIALTRSLTNPDEFIYDSTLFFPLTDADGFGIENTKDVNGDLQNFHFTTEIHTLFTYEAGQVFSFRGDDDLWVFVDDNLVIDLGGLHPPRYGSVDMDTLGLVEGSSYTMDIFHAERHTTGSNFKITTNIAGLLSSMMDIPINGKDFPDMTPNTQVGNDGSMANAALLEGDTRTTSNAYTGEPTDNSYLFAGNDALWELGPITDGVDINVSLCDYGGTADLSKGADPTLALFNCFGERVAYNDDGGNCNGEESEIVPTPVMSRGVSPYYLLVDGKYDPGNAGVSGGYPYNVSLYYDPVPEPLDTDTDFVPGVSPTVPCDPSASVNNIEVDITQGNPNIGDLYFYPDGCILVNDNDGNWFQQGTPPHGGGPYYGIKVRSSGVKDGNSECYKSGGLYSYCFPFRFYYDLLYKDAAGSKECRLQGFIECHDGHFNNCTGGHNGDGTIPTPQSCPSDSTCDQFVNMGIGWTYPASLTAEERVNCETHCNRTNTMFLKKP